MLLTVFIKYPTQLFIGHIFDTRVMRKKFGEPNLWTPVIDVIFYTNFTKDGNRVLRSTEKHFISKMTERNYDL